MKILLFISLFAFYGAASAASLCSLNEKTIFAFETTKKKMLSICKERSDGYLVYRYGRLGAVELQFPAKLDSGSWNKFEFSGSRRPGGKSNAGFGDYSIIFGIGDIGYTVFQEWSDEEDTYSIGVIVSGKGKPITIHGIKETQEGSLVLLEGEKNIKNHAW